MRDEETRRLFVRSMDTLRLSGADKKRLTDALMEQAARQEAEKETANMKLKWKRTAILALAAALAIGALSAGAVYLAGRSRTLEAELHMTDEQRQRAEESGLSSLPDAQRTADEVTSATGNGVTVTVEQAIVDNYYAMLSFRVDGYSPEDGKEPAFGASAVRVSGDSEAVTAWSAGFYDGIVVENGRAARYDDGSPLEYGADGELLFRYVSEDGSLHYHIDVSAQEPLIGKTLEVFLQDIGTAWKAEFYPEIKGAWALKWTVRGSDEIRTVYPEQPLGDSGAVLTEADISPISLRAVYRLSDEMSDALKNAIDDDEVVPRLLGVRMKDGTLYPYLYKGPGMGGSPGENLYETRFAVDRILDPQDIDAFLFLKSYPDTPDEELTEENLYIVPLA